MVPHRPFELKEYDPDWKKRFLDAAEKLKPIFGENLIEIEHIGSTSIEGMVAKPQIDILVVVRDLDAVKNCYKSFIAVGYTPRGRGYTNKDDEYFTEDSLDGRRLTSVHTLQEGNPEIEGYKIFRDYLRVSQEDRKLYISTKRDLYSSHHDNIAEYYRGKTSVIDSIQARANEWAKN
jgi:GrpB-like predicted nucleotidyltransferase (UPF0157 family)